MKKEINNLVCDLVEAIEEKLIQRIKSERLFVLDGVVAEMNEAKVSTRRNTGRRLILVTKWNDYYDYPSIGGLRHLIFFKETNGFNKVVKKIGSRLLIDEEKFFEWIEETNS